MSNSRRILIVDDDAMNRKLLAIALSRLGHQVDQAGDGLEALEMVSHSAPDLILLDIDMPRLNGYETAQRLKKDPETSTIPILVVSSLWDVADRVKAIDAGADDFLSKPVDQTELKARVRSLLKVKAYNDHMLRYQKKLELDVNKRTEELSQAYEKIKEVSLDTIFRLSQAAEYKDEDTGNHIVRISYYSKRLAEYISMSLDEIEAITHAAPMHDVGKIGIPDNILLKPGKLDDREWDIMKTHSLIGGKILAGSDSDVISMAETISMTHHEKWDGSGYPNGLKGEEIPMVGRITAIVDVFDALTSKRPYKEAFSIGKSMAIIKDMGEKHFDKGVMEAFFDIEDELVKIRQEHQSD